MSFSLIAYLSAGGANGDVEDNFGSPTRLESLVRELPDSLFHPVQVEDLLDDQVYLDLAREGWSSEEIVGIMSTALVNKSVARMKTGYGYYAKQWLPTYGRQPGGDSLYMFIDTLYTEKMRQSVARRVPADLLNAWWPTIQYIPPKMRSGGGQENQRIPGYFRQPMFLPSCGRIHWIALHPEDHDKLYVVPDGAGIFKTDNGGTHWECITDKIPVRAHRSNVSGYSIPVDPDDWDHLFGFMNNSVVYETTDGGESWRQIEGATHKGFKRGDCFRDADGNLKFIGCTNKGWGSKLWISEDTCKTWTEVAVPAELKDINPLTGERGLWFQYIVTDPTDRNKIYLPTSRSILYFDDGARSETVDGRKVYNIKKMSFEVYDGAHSQRRYADHSGDKGADPTNNTIFPCPANAVGDLVINPNNPNQWWFATASQINGGASSAVYRSEDAGRTWVTLQDVAFNIGSGNAFGNEVPFVWLGGFGVDFADTTRVYGCTMSSGKSFDGGRNFSTYSWAIGRPGRHTDGLYYNSSYSRHNADNHCIRSHKSGRVFRGSDGGMFMIDPRLEVEPSRFRGDWLHIGGDMGQMLFYHVTVNEFGDQLMAGNTQDIDGQTYRYGRWGRWRGYEGSESLINPYTNTVYFPLMGNQGLDGTNFQLDSWANATTRADVVTGSWFLARAGGVGTGRSFLRCDDQGHNLVNLEPIIGEAIGGIFSKFGLCRDKGRSTVFVITRSHVYKRSTDGGQTFETLLTPSGVPVKFSNSAVATDPNNSDVLYIGQQGAVHRYNILDGTLEKLGGESLPRIPCTNLIFHEGSGDLYFYHAASAGIYILEYDKQTGQYAPAWRYWTKGYNSGKSTNIEINYTSQEMVICDYGRGVWVADLEHPSDRFFENGFRLKELSFKDGRRTIGIDTEWTIPLYYYFKWTVNGEEIDNPYQYLRRALNPGDRVQLELTLRESPDVHTLSSVLTVADAQSSGSTTPEVARADAPMAAGGTAATAEGEGTDAATSFDNPVVKEPGHALYSNGRGRVDLGYIDYFFNDFTIDFWLKPNSNGTILANTSRIGDPKGWELSVDGGALKFLYYPLNQMPFANYETAVSQNATVRGGSLNFGEWNHVAVTHEREGNIVLYINGHQVASGARIRPEGTLNNSSILSLFADAIELYPIEATVDELKIWTRSLTQDEVRQEMYSTNAGNKDGLVAYYPFNGGSLGNEIETFTRRPVRSRVLAEVQYPLMTVPTCATRVAHDQASGTEHIFAAGTDNLIKFTLAPGADGDADDEGQATPASLSGDFGIYGYEVSQWQNEEDNIDTDFFDQYPVGYLIHPFDGTDVDNLTVDFYPVAGAFDPNKHYRLYCADINAEKQAWVNMGDMDCNTGTGTLRMSGLRLSDIADRKLLIVTTKPSIELFIEGLGADGILPVYDESQSTFPLTANILPGLEEPSDVYQIEADGILKPSGLYFAQGSASGELRLDLSKLGTFNSSVRATLRSNDNAVRDDSLGRMRPSLIPLTIEVRNRIMPREVGTGIKLTNARADIGNALDFKELAGSRNLTIMGWVRIDSVKNLQHGGFNLMALYHPSGQGVTAVRLNRGRLEFAHNGAVRGTSNKLSIAEADLGKWTHVAAVLDSASNTFRLYMNGRLDKGNYNGGGGTRSVISFHVGKNSAAGNLDNNDSFCGAVDQVGVWNRALSHDEVIRYMYSAPALNDPGLLSYQNMDYADANDVRRDCYNLSEIKLLPVSGLAGTASFDEPTAIPFDARGIADATAPESPIALTFPEGKQRDAVIATFRGTPYCYLNHEYQNYTALLQEYYSVTYRDYTNVGAEPDDMVTLTYRHRIIADGERLAVAVRKTGTPDHLAGFIPASSVTAGEATFEVPYSFLTHASEIMFFTYPDESGDPGASRQASIQLDFARSILPDINTDGEVPTFVLPDDMTEIPVIADILRMPSNSDTPVRIIVNESTYATPTQETIDFSASENQFAIRIDPDKIDPFGINTLTLNLEGASANEVRLNFYKEPYVYLSLLNGDDREVVTPGSESASGARRRAALMAASETGNAFRTLTPVANLEINAELLQGFLPQGQKIELEVVTDMDYSMNIGNGRLLTNDEVSYGNLEHHTSDSGPRHEGWNLIGNPYLTNINLTKSKNVNYDAERVTQFLYQADPATGNYRVYSMTDYNASQSINPFQAYFVQTMAEEASFSITPVAKEVEPTKRTMAYNAVEKRQLVLELSRDGVPFDEVTLIYDENGDKNFVVNEDAPKMWNISGSAPELYALTDDHEATAVNAGSGFSVPLGLKNPAEGTLTLAVKSATGLPEDELVIRDNETGTDWKPFEQGNVYTFTAPEGDSEGRFTVTLLNDTTTGLDSSASSGYTIVVDNGACTIMGLQGAAWVNVFTPSGVSVVSVETGNPELTITLAPGFYIVVIHENGKDYTAKIKV